MGSSKRRIRNRAQPNSDHQKWEIIYNALKQLLRKQALQLDLLVEERKLLQHRIHSQCQRWNSDLRLLEDAISQKQIQLSLSEFGRLFEVTKAELLLGSKKRDALDISPNRMYESLKAKDGRHNTSKAASSHNSKLEKEIAALKHEYEKLSVKHKSELDALQDENKFVWNQYKALEDSYTNQLNTKNDEIDQANEKVMNLLKSMEQLQSESIEKDETVATLKAKNTKLEAEVNEKDGDICRLSKEIELLRSKFTEDVPLSDHCSPELSSSLLKGRRNSRKVVTAALEEDATFVQQQATISFLRARVSELESEGNRKSEEVSRLSKELKLLSSKVSSDLPVLKRCINEPSSSKSRGRGNHRNVGTASVEEEASFMQLEATIATLKNKISEFEAQANQKNGEISALSEGLKLLKSKSAADTPVLRQCTSQPSSSRSRGKKDGRDKDSIALKKETSLSQQVTEQVT
ncbi:Laminin subunit alpha-2 [Bienertia sinuspersici]